MRFLLDTQLPRRLARWLRDRGHEAEHVLDIGLAQDKDNAIWRRAIADGAVIVTKDEDFAEWVRRGRAGPSVLWLRTGNGRTRELLAFLEPVLDAAVARLEAGDLLVEIR